MSFIISPRDPALADVSDTALRQLAKLLYLDAADYAASRAPAWLAKQEHGVKDLDASLLRPKDLLARLAISMSKRKLPFSPEGAKLCAAHKALDPRVVRNMLVLVADECTIQTNRYRSLRLKQRLTPSLEGWLARMDFLTLLWLGEDRFERIFGRAAAGENLPECVRTQCEACMLSVVGGSALYLTDLRASVLARQAYNHAKETKTATTTTTTPPRKPPRLLRIVDAWISYYKPDCQQVVCACSESIVSDIVAMRTLARQRRDKEDARRRKRGKPPRPPHCHSRVRLTDQGLPIPRQAKLREGDRARISRRAEKRRAERPMSTLLEREKQASNERLWQALEAHDSRGSSAAQEDTGDDPATGVVKEDDWDDDWLWLSDEEDVDADEKDDDDGEEYWVRDYRRLILQGESSTDGDGGSGGLGVGSRLTFGPNTRIATAVTDTLSWTSRVEEDDDDDDDASDVDSLRTVKDLLPHHEEAGLPAIRAASSIYSCDEREGFNPFEKTIPFDKTNPFDKTLSVLSGFTRESAVPLPLRLGTSGKTDERNSNRRTALAMLEGREGREDTEVASCYETMGWGGPR